MQMQPSILAHMLNGILLFASIFLIVFYAPKLDTFRTIILLILLSIAAGIHGLSHLGLERVYGYNPLSATQKHLA
jgi:hypothetical protein